MDNGRRTNKNETKLNSPLGSVSVIRSTDINEEYKRVICKTNEISPSIRVTDAMMMRTTQSILYNSNTMTRKAGTITSCSRFGAHIHKMGKTILVEFNSKGSMTIKGPRKVCRSRLCPLCSKLHARNDVKQIENFFIAAKNLDLMVEFFTFTKGYNINIRNSVNEALGGISKVNKAVSNYRNKKKEDVSSMILMEASFSRVPKPARGGFYSKMAHIHAHGLVAYPSDLSKIKVADLRVKMEKAWRLGVESNGGFIFTNEENKKVVYDWKNTTNTREAITGLAKYFNIQEKGNGKERKSSTIHYELTSTNKNAKGRGIHTMLREIVTSNDDVDKQMFIDYFYATKGRQTFRKSKRWLEIAEKGKLLRDAVNNRLNDESYYWIGDAFEIDLEKKMPMIKDERRGICKTNDALDKFLGEDVLRPHSLPQIRSHVFKLQKQVNKLHLESLWPDLKIGQKKSIEEEIVELNTRIRKINEAVVWTEEQSEIQEEMEADSKKPKVLGSVEFNIHIWNALSWNSSSLWLVLDFCDVAICEGKNRKAFTDFNKWLKSKEDYVNENRKIDDTIIQLDKWVDKITMLSGLRRVELLIKVENRWAS